ncbi:hypothetical protein AB832_01620 [Flavobacteriaceae bacterium (ex Bugula neritina AB1)]|nr:hypothetical protein AB832_01620 [Flavobacteriaceae bacterium (ex Bugula neritina AB1)]
MLTKDTDYQLYVRANCGAMDGFSKWSVLNFRTLATCISPSNVSITNERCNSFDIDWVTNNSETSWDVLVQTVGSSDEFTISADTKPVTIENLFSNRTYRVYVRAICSEDDKSRYQDTPGFAKTTSDDEAPLAISKNITVELNNDGNVIVNANDLNNGSTDNCGISNIQLQPGTSFDCSDIGESTVFINVTDFGSNNATAMAVLTIEDNIPPVAQCVAPFNIQLDNSGNATITASDINNASTDNCTISSIEIDKSTFTTADIGENTITLTITDTSGNASICTTSVTVEGTALTLEDYITGLTTPRGLAFDTNGDLYIAEHFSGKIFKATDVGTSTEFASTGFRNNNISFNANGTLYTTDDFFSQIFQIDTDGTSSVYLNSSNNGISSPWGITFDSNGNLYYSNQFDGKVIKVAPDQTTSDYATGLFNAEGIAFDSNGNLFIADRSDRKLIKVEPNGTKTTVLSGLKDIRAIAIDSEDNIYFNKSIGLSSPTITIVKYNQTDQTETDVISSGLTDVNELVFNTAGDLFIAQDDRVSVIRGVAEPSVLSIEEFSNPTITFYPNPLINQINFEKDIKSIKVYNIAGKKVFEGKGSKRSFDLSSLNSGLYLLQIENLNTQISVQKIIKQQHLSVK